ncbi:hypothetical protein [Curtobacterium flaccumfaciens]|uniref:hypothetical protein n=1 Tax=Curtobacterium flaccumfaciens TaxID=2035 RepID=UPI0039968843
MSPFKYVTPNDAQTLGDLVTRKPTNAALIRFASLQTDEQRLVRAELTARAEDRQQGRVLTVLVAAVTLVIGFLGLIFNVAFGLDAGGLSWMGPAATIGGLVFLVIVSYLLVWVRIEYLDSRALRARAMLEALKS